MRSAALLELLGFSSGLTGIAALNLVRKQTDRLLVGLALGPATLGLYTNAQRLVELVTHVATQPFSQLAFPLFARLRADPPALRATYCRTVQTTCACAFPLAIGLSAFAPDAVPLVLAGATRNPHRAKRFIATLPRACRSKSV
jgi:O-antigen/teichoic acid export membrane protein